MKLITCYDIQPFYLINENGDVYKNGNKLKSHKDHNGYLQIKLTKTNKRRGSYLIHRLVALTYIPNPNNLETVNHIDGNKLNNNVNNLEWLSMYNNLKHAKQLGYNGSYRDIDDEIIKIVIKELEYGHSVNYICNKYNVSKNFVSRIRQNRRHKHIKRNIISTRKKYTLEEKKEICYLILNNVPNSKINKYYGTSKSYCYNIKNGLSHTDVMDFVIKNNFEPSTTIKNHFKLNGE